MAIASRLEDIPLLSDGACRALGPILDEDGLVKLQIGLVEAANNIVNHACKGRSDRTIRLSCVIHGHGVTLVLEDDGAPPCRDLNQAVAAMVACEPPDVLAESGRGLWLIRRCFSSVRFESGDGVNRLLLSCGEREGGEQEEGGREGGG